MLPQSEKLIKISVLQQKDIEIYLSTLVGTVKTLLIVKRLHIHVKTM